MESIIYSYKSPSGKFYIGQTIDEEKRKREHKSMSDKCRKFNNAIKKYGFENFKYLKIFKFKSDDSEYLHFISDKLEQKLIKRYNSYNKGYNMTLGGKGQNGFCHTEESKKKISEIKKKTAKRGKDHPMYGRHMAEDHPAKKFWFSKGQKAHNAKCVKVTNELTKESRIFESLKLAVEFAGCKSSTVCANIKRGNNKSKGFIFEYIERSTTSDNA
jgi:group I intron endonuclease